MTDHSHHDKQIWFLDFEGNKAGDVFLAGVLNSGKFQQVVLDQRLSGLAKYLSLEIKSPIEFIDALIAEIRNSEGVIAAYSNAEKNVIDRIYLKSGCEPPDYTYCNLHAAAKMWAKRYKKREFADLPPLKKTANKFEAKRHPYSLASIVRLFELEAPTDYAIGKTTKRINAVISGLNAKKGVYENLTRTQKRQSTQFLKHNQFDVVSLPVLLDKIASTDLSLFSKSGWSPLMPTNSNFEETNDKNKTVEKVTKKREQPSKELTKIREKSPKAYKRWSTNEEEKLIKLFNDGWAVDEISKALGRQTGGIRSRLVQFELIDPHDVSM